MQIPVFKKAVDSIADEAMDSPDAPHSLKPLPPLVAVRLGNSCHRLILYRCSYFLFVVSLLFAFYPYILEQPVWVLGLMLSVVGLWLMYRREMTNDLVGSLGFADNTWVFEQGGRRYQLELVGEVVCWPWIIILPFREVIASENISRETTGKKTRRLLIFNDTLCKEDNARLRAWLRACLVPKA
ncbi:MAG: protein YgfX [Cellvibrio sp.]|uniref:protein YgfX n=1 Tax=Cellvibrio sp. TaxID=1965322 RepID=UPI0031A777A8